jgi:hypothetical protein
MQKYVRAAIVGRNEAKALDGVEPLDLAGHFDDLVRAKMGAKRRRVRVRMAPRRTQISGARFFVHGCTSAQTALERRAAEKRGS